MCDVVEFTELPEGVKLPGEEGLHLPAPVEYKRGHEKRDACDEAQMRPGDVPGGDAVCQYPGGLSVLW